MPTKGWAIHHLRAIQLLLGHTKIESTVRYLGVELDDALEIGAPTENGRQRARAEARSAPHGPTAWRQGGRPPAGTVDGRWLGEIVPIRLGPPGTEHCRPQISTQTWKSQLDVTRVRATSPTLVGKRRHVRVDV